MCCYVLQITSPFKQSHSKKLGKEYKFCLTTGRLTVQVVLHTNKSLSNSGFLLKWKRPEGLFRKSLENTMHSLFIIYLMPLVYNCVPCVRYITAEEILRYDIRITYSWFPFGINLEISYGSYGLQSVNLDIE